MDKSVYIAKTKKIQIVSSIVIIGFVIAIFYHYFMSAYLGHKQFFYRSFLYDSAISFGDFWGNVDCVRTLSPYSRIGVERICSFPYYSVYYPFGQLIYYPFTFFFNKYLSLIVFFVIFFAGWYLFIIKNFSQNNKIDNIRDIFIISCASYPLIITVDRANLEAYVFLLVAVFCFFYNSNKKKQVLLASIFLSLAIAIKPFPVLFLLLLVKEKKWKNILFIIISTTIITSASALCFQEGLWGSFVGLTRNQSDFIKRTLLRDLGPDHGHSLLGLLKKISYPFLRFSHTEMKDILTFWNQLLFHLSLILSVILILFVVWYILVKERSFWKIVALIVFLMLLTAPGSYDYRLLHVFLPLAFFVNDDSKNKNDLIYTVLFGLLLIPQAYILPAYRVTHITDMIGIFTEPLLMLTFIFLIITEGLKRKI